MIKIVLGTPRQTGRNVEVCFPIGNYKETYQKLNEAGIGDALKRDCWVMEVVEGIPILEWLKWDPVNVDELDYLSKRLESFDQGRTAKFQGVIFSRGYTKIRDFINLTFCCQEVTVIQDFRDLEAIGRDHYVDTHGSETGGEMEATDFRGDALSLIVGEIGKVTPYGVVYKNGMQLGLSYDGKNFPRHDHDCGSVLVVAISKLPGTGDPKDVTWLYLPMEECQIERAMLRAGISRCDDMDVQFARISFPAVMEGLFASCGTDLELLNDLCRSFKALDGSGRDKLASVIQMADPPDIPQARNLMEQLDLFDFIPCISTPEEYGRHMIIESGHYKYDCGLEEFYDFKQYGEQRMGSEYGMFTDKGYISYHGFLSIEEVMAGSNSERMEMTMGGGM